MTVEFIKGCVIHVGQAMQWRPLNELPPDETLPPPTSNQQAMFRILSGDDIYYRHGVPKMVEVKLPGPEVWDGMLTPENAIALGELLIQMGLKAGE